MSKTMSSEKIFSNLELFISELKLSGVNKIAFAETLENRAIEATPGELKVDVYRLLELLAYKKPSLYKITINNPDFDSIYNSLADQGFEITRSKRNIT